MRLVSGGSLNAGRKGNGVKAASVSYEGAKLAVPPVDYVKPSLVVMADSTYYLRISVDTTNTWSEGDNYAKATVVSVSGDSLKVTLKLAYQKRPGFRWLAN